MSVPNSMTINPRVVGLFLFKASNVDVMVALESEAQVIGFIL